MSSLFSKIALATYRGVGMALYPFMGPLLRYRASRGKEERTRRYERYGYPSADKPKGPIVWFHAASVGESMAAIALVEHVHSLGINTIMTTGTVTSAQLMRERLPKSSFHQYVPLDLQPAMERFLDHWQPDLAIFTESEIWPTTIMELAKRKIPPVLINARMSERSFKLWNKSKAVGQTIFDKFSYVIAQSEGDATRFKRLGARPVDLTGNIKTNTDPMPYDEAERDQLAAAISGRPVWIAASTHEGEEKIAGAIHVALKKAHPGLLTMIAPRHPNRAEGITALLRSNGVEVAVRSLDEAILPSTDVYLCDTIGEMGLFYNLAPISFVGKSLLDSGGHNPIEPIVCGSAVLSGQKVDSFYDTYKSLVAAGAVRLVSNEKMLAENIHFLLRDKVERERMIAAGKKSILENSGGLDKTKEVLDSYIFPLTVRREFEELN